MTFTIEDVRKKVYSEIRPYLFGKKSISVKVNRTELGFSTKTDVGLVGEKRSLYPYDTIWHGIDFEKTPHTVEQVENILKEGLTLDFFTLESL